MPVAMPMLSSMKTRSLGDDVAAGARGVGAAAEAGQAAVEAADAFFQPGQCVGEAKAHGVVQVQAFEAAAGLGADGADDAADLGGVGVADGVGEGDCVGARGDQGGGDRDDAAFGDQAVDGAAEGGAESALQFDRGAGFAQPGGDAGQLGDGFVGAAVGVGAAVAFADGDRDGDALGAGGGGASCAPRRLGARATIMAGRPFRARMTASVSAIWGMTRAGTKLPTSIRGTPAAAMASIQAILSGVAMRVAAICRPSRGPTSRTITFSPMASSACGQGASAAAVVQASTSAGFRVTWLKPNKAHRCVASPPWPACYPLLFAPRSRSPGLVGPLRWGWCRPRAGR